MPINPPLLSKSPIRAYFGLLTDEDVSTFIDGCNLVVPYLLENPGIPKIRKKDWSQLFPGKPTPGRSFLKLDSGIYALSGHLLGGRKFNRKTCVKYSLRIYPESDELWAMKIQYSKDFGTQSDATVEADMMAEVAIGRRMGFFTSGLLTRSHPSQGHKYYLIGPYKGINLHQWLSTHQPSSEQRLKVAISLCSTLHDMQVKHRIVHGDIKPTNILIHPDTLEITVGDFGTSSAPGVERALRMSGTVLYLPILDMKKSAVEQVKEIQALVRWPFHRDKMDFFALRRVLRLPFSGHMFKGENAPLPLLDPATWDRLPPDLQTILCTYPVTRETFYCADMNADKLAQHLIRFASAQGNAIPRRLPEQKEKEVAEVQPSFKHLEDFLSQLWFKETFQINSPETLIEECKQAYARFQTHRTAQKIGRNEMDHSFLYIDGGIYLLARRKIGWGVYGFVKYAVRIDQEDRELYTVKIQYQKNPIETEERVRLEQELSIGQHMRFFTQKHLFLRTNVGKHHLDKAYMISPDGGRDLSVWMKCWVKNSMSPSEGERYQIAFNLCMAIHAMHTGEMSVAHRDLKPQNILVNEKKQVTVADFGLACFNTPNPIPERGTMLYLPLNFVEDRVLTEEELKVVLNVADERVRQMGLFLPDVFALKRILWMPYSLPSLPSISSPTDITPGEQRSLLTPKMRALLPEKLFKMIDTSKPEEIYLREDQPLEIAARLILAMFKVTAPEEMDISLQEEITRWAQDYYAGLQNPQFSLGVRKQLSGFTREGLQRLVDKSEIAAPSP